MVPSFATAFSDFAPSANAASLCLRSSGTVLLGFRALVQHFTSIGPALRSYLDPLHSHVLV
jgi:hypothetical protein